MKNKTKLPEEILMEIFTRLPTKAIGKCRCLSKRWRFNLSTPEFIKTHKGQQHVILLTPSQSLHCINTVTKDAFSFNIDLSGRWVRLIGSCNGFILLGKNQLRKFQLGQVINKEENEKLLLLNVMTRQHLIIPDSFHALHEYFNFKFIAFGYDSRGHDYKIVVISSSYEVDLNVYSVKKGVWKKIRNDCDPYINNDHVVSYGCFVNGSIHWIGRRNNNNNNNSYVIAVFDLADEVFDEIPTPIGFDMEMLMSYKLVVCGGTCLCMIDTRLNSPTDIWIMKEYGVRKSWTKISVDADHYQRAINVLCFIGDKEVVLMMGGGSLVVYNVKDGSLKDLMVDGAPAMVTNHGSSTFVDNLLVRFPAINAFNNY